MLFIAMAKVNGSTTKQRLGRRVEWQYPEGMKVVGEYWLQNADPVVVSVVEADNIAPIMAATSQWDDYLEWRVFPAVEAKEGLGLAKKLLG